MMIRLAHTNQIDVLRELVMDAYRHYVERLGQEPAPMQDNYAARIAAGQVSVLEVDGAIVGLVVLIEEPMSFLLQNVAVASAARGKGYGKALVAFAEDEARRRGFDEIRLYTHVLMTENIALYGRLGYHETARISEDGYDRVYMAKPISPEPEDFPRRS